MRYRIVMMGVIVAVSALMVAGGRRAVAERGSPELVPVRKVEAAIDVEDVVANRRRVSARLVNHTDHTVQNVRLLVQERFAWANEFKPGPDNPGRASVHVVDAEIPPHGSVVFTQPIAPPLPDRPDGTFHTEVLVLGYTQVG
jgi:hypothetical protein